MNVNTESTKEINLDAHACCGGCSEVDDLVGEPANHRSAASFLKDLLWIALCTAVLGSLLSAHHWLWVAAHWNDSTAPVPMGTVQQIRYIGDWSIHTQIDTEDHSLVVRGMTKLKKGSRVEQRKTWNSLQLCAVEVIEAVKRDVKEGAMHGDNASVHCEDLVQP